MAGAYRDIVKAHLCIAAEAAKQGCYLDAVTHLRLAIKQGSNLGIIIPLAFSDQVLFQAAQNKKVCEKVPESKIEGIIRDALSARSRYFMEKAEEAGQSCSSSAHVRQNQEYLEEVAENLGQAAIYSRLAGDPLKEEQTKVFYKALESYFQSIRNRLQSQVLGAETNPSSIISLTKRLSAEIRDETRIGDREGLDISGKMLAVVYLGFSLVISDAIAFARHHAKEHREGHAAHKEPVAGLTPYAAYLASYFDVRIPRSLYKK